MSPIKKKTLILARQVILCLTFSFYAPPIAAAEAPENSDQWYLGLHLPPFIVVPVTTNNPSGFFGLDAVWRHEDLGFRVALGPGYAFVDCYNAAFSLEKRFGRSWLGWEIGGTLSYVENLQPEPADLENLPDGQVTYTRTRTETSIGTIGFIGLRALLPQISGAKIRFTGALGLSAPGPNLYDSKSDSVSETFQSCTDTRDSLICKNRPHYDYDNFGGPLYCTVGVDFAL